MQCLVGVSHEIGRGAQGDSCGATEVRSPWTWRGGAPHCSRVMVGAQSWSSAALAARSVLPSNRPATPLFSPASPPPSCWEQLLLCRRGAARRGAGTGAGAGLGTAGGRLALGVACPNPSKSQGLGAASAGTRGAGGAGSAREQGVASLSKTATRALCARPRRQGRRPRQTSWGAGALGRFLWKASSPTWVRGPASSADDTRNWML